MKKILLFLTGGIISLSAFAQERANNSVAFILSDEKQAEPAYQHVKVSDLHQNKTTAAPTSRWYNYADWLDASTNGSTAFSFPYMWNDTASVDAYAGGTYSHNRSVSIASVMDPYFASFYDDLYYPAADYMTMTSDKPYVVDSLTIYGAYGKNPAKTSVVDTLTIGYTYGTGLPLNNATEDIWKDGFDASFASQVLTRYNLPATDTLWYKSLYYDSVRNSGNGLHFAKHIITISGAGTSTNTTANWGDTTANGLFAKRFGLATPMNVPAGSIVGVTISFKSGDPAFVADDTVFRGSTFPGDLYKYHMFRPVVAYKTTSAGGTTADFATYSHTDNNEGLFKTLPNYLNGWRNVYVPMWAWTATGGTASQSQYPYIDVHIKCATCTTNAVEDIRAGNVVSVSPNPAVNELKVSFELGAGSNTSVTLTNMVGQVVAVQNIGNVSKGTAVFNTSTLPSGIYVYTVLSNGVRSVGRAVIAH